MTKKNAAAIKRGDDGGSGASLRERIIDSTAALVARDGLQAITEVAIASSAHIGIESLQRLFGRMDPVASVVDEIYERQFWQLKDMLEDPARIAFRKALQHAVSDLIACKLVARALEAGQYARHFAWLEAPAVRASRAGKLTKVLLLAGAAPHLTNDSSARWDKQAPELTHDLVNAVVWAPELARIMSLPREVTSKLQSIDVASVIQWIDAANKSRMEILRMEVESDPFGLSRRNLLHRRTLPVRIYLSDSESASDVEQAVVRLLNSCDFELVQESDPERSSWWKRLWFRSARGIDEEDIYDFGRKTARAIEIEHLEKRQADVTQKLASATRSLIASLETIETAAIQVGNVLIVKHKDPVLGPVLTVRTLSAMQLRMLENQPEILKDPRNVLARLGESQDADLPRKLAERTSS